MTGVQTCALPISTDYDCWHESHESVTIDMVINNLTQNVGRAKQILQLVVPQLAGLSNTGKCGCDSALANALITDRTRIPDTAKEKFGLLVEKYL